MTVHYDDLLINSDHAVGLIDTVEREPKSLTLPQASTRAEQDEQRVPSRHSSREGQDLGGCQQADYGLADLGKTDIRAWRPAEVAIADGSSHDAGKDDVNRLDRARC